MAAHEVEGRAVGLERGHGGEGEGTGAREAEEKRGATGDKLSMAFFVGPKIEKLKS